MDEHPDGYVIVTGNVFGGIKIHVNRDGRPFYHAEEAVEAAEREFHGDEWNIARAHKIEGE